MNTENKDMPRQKQKNIAVPLEYWDRIEKLYKAQEEKLRTVEIDSPVKLLKVLANFGIKPFLAFLDGKKSIEEVVEEAHKSHKATKEKSEEL